MEKIEELQPIKTRSRFETAVKERKQIELEESLENLSKYLDNWIKIPVVGWRFGLDAIIGLIPNVGDTLTSFASFYILLAGVRHGVPKITILRMAFNIGLDYAVGVIPVLGDAFDFVWKANKKNIDLIRERGTGNDKGAFGDYLFVGLIILALIAILIGSIAASVYILFLIFGNLRSGF